MGSKNNEFGYETWAILPTKFLGVNPRAWYWTQKVGTGQEGQTLMGYTEKLNNAF